MVWESARLSFPLDGRSGHPSRGDVSRAGNWAGPRKSPSGRQIPTGLEASGVRASLPDSLASGPLCPLSLLWEENLKSREGYGQSHTARRWQSGKFNLGLQSLLAGCIASKLGSPVPSGLGASLLVAVSPTTFPQQCPQLPVSVRV